MSDTKRTDTPRTDAVAREHAFISDNGNKVVKAQNVDAEFARTLERENAELREALYRILIASDRRMANGGDMFDYQDTNRQAGDIARAALSKAKGA